MMAHGCAIQTSIRSCDFLGDVCILLCVCCRLEQTHRNLSFIIAGDMPVLIYLSCCHPPGKLLLSYNPLRLVMPQQPFCCVRHKSVE